MKTAMKSFILISTVALSAYSQSFSDPAENRFLKKLQGKEEAMKGFAKMMKEFKNYAEASAN